VSALLNHPEGAGGFLGQEADALLEISAAARLGCRAHRGNGTKKGREDSDE